MIDFDMTRAVPLNEVGRFFKQLNGAQGVYGLWYGKECLYIGFSNNLWDRITTHKKAYITKDMKTNKRRWNIKEMYEFIESNRNDIKFTYIESAFKDQERLMLKKYQPKWNIQGVYNAYQYPKIKDVGYNWG